ncbi:hypothetical protein [Paenibacillus gansuensis]|uniref:VCBS repeat-containing protein n=1 Tax=Paenibacillus gansuensis TaxID=306542 RepID=A0ABW5PI65_9BACL
MQNHCKTALAAVAAAGCLSLLPWASAAAASGNVQTKFIYPQIAPAKQVVQTSEGDVTGDGKLDKIELLGIKKDPASNYYDKLVVKVTGGGDGKSAETALGGGYTPTVRLCDFTGDGALETFVTASTGGSGGLSTFYLNSWAKGQPKTLALPVPLKAVGTYENNYIVKFDVPEQKKSFRIDVRDKKADYDQSGLYRGGLLTRPQSADVLPFSELRPMDTDRDGICELVGFQRATGLYNADTVAYALSLWKYQGNKWKLVNTVVVKAKV